MENNILTPFNFTDTPMNSIFKDYNYEIIAQNIMKILKRTGNKFRLLTWDEYKTIRQKDGYFSESEKKYFLEVVGFCVNAERAQQFCSDWAEH